MTPKHLWLVVLVALFILPIQSLNCVHLDNAILESVKLLGSISSSSPLKCLKEIKDFEFPKEILSYIQNVKGDMKEAFYRLSIEALNIFSHNGSISPVTKERLQRIRMRLFEQVQQAQDCFMDEEKENTEGDRKPQHTSPKDLQRVYLELNKYFTRIKKFLREKNYSFCAWMIVGAEMRRCFMIFYNFKKLLKMH
ncbi:interferon kappa [Meriones unguiculatus]|uniref:interferon kappa n=1 Tax=Meriones unguiculatus TaxID=10047 RepID=UPI000B4F4D2F|nr:interferon kappa [Meriones unguiculatus]